MVEVVTSPSAPRVKTFSGTNSPTSAKSANIATSGERRQTKIAHAVEREADSADSADRDDGGDVGIELDRVGWRGRSFRRFLVARDRGRSDALGTTTCGRYEPVIGLAPLEAGAEPLEEHGHDTRDEREAVEACLHHGLTSVSWLPP